MNFTELRERADSGNVAAQSILGICYLEGIDGVEVNYKEAFRYLAAAADKGASRARFHLGRMYEHGLGVSQDSRKAMDLYELAAAAGEFFAQIQLGRVYSTEKGTPRNRQEALRWYSAAVAQQGNVEDCAELQEAKDYLEREFRKD